jgi:hypothetical protein
MQTGERKCGGRNRGGACAQCSKCEGPRVSCFVAWGQRAGAALIAIHSPRPKYFQTPSILIETAFADCEDFNIWIRMKGL